MSTIAAVFVRPPMHTGVQLKSLETFLGKFSSVITHSEGKLCSATNSVNFTSALMIDWSSWGAKSE